MSHRTKFTKTGAVSISDLDATIKNAGICIDGCAWDSDAELVFVDFIETPDKDKISAVESIIHSHRVADNTDVPVTDICDLSTMNAHDIDEWYTEKLREPATKANTIDELRHITQTLIEVQSRALEITLLLRDKSSLDSG
jgi:hypothetical protein